MRAIRLQDTRSGSLLPLEPRQPGRVGIYACGPTVYNRIHIGNARPYVVFSLLKRFLEHEGLDATLVVNVTDVNDKIYDAARDRGVPSEDLARSSPGMKSVPSSPEIGRKPSSTASTSVSTRNAGHWSAPRQRQRSLERQSDSSAMPTA